MASGSLHKEVVGRIRDMIVEGEIPAGAHVPERIICEKLNISRTPLREAYKVLAAEGLLTLLPNRGVIVTQLTHRDAEDILTMIGLIGGLAAERACDHISDEEIDRIEAMHKVLVQYYQNRDLAGYFKQNQAIHDAIVQAAKSPQMEHTHRSLVLRVQRLRFAGNAESARWASDLREHEQFIHVLRERDGKLLNAMIQAHLRNGWKIIRKHFGNELAGAPDETIQSAAS